MLALRCNSNLILFGQLRKNRITYHDNPITITLMKNGKVIAEVRKERNLFIFDLVDPKKAIIVISSPNNTKHHDLTKMLYISSKVKQFLVWTISPRQQCSYIKSSKTCQWNKTRWQQGIWPYSNIYWLQWFQCLWQQRNIYTGQS